VGRLATVDRWQRPAIVPFCFALIDADDPVVVSVLDEKPKRVADADLARTRNIEHNPEVAFIVDHYEEDWSRLWFMQVRGRASLLAPGTHDHASAVAALREKYPQYRKMAIETRLVIRIAGLHASSWRAAGSSALSE
jgi:PPOX class probable F420-dependent enzyme